MKRLVLASCMLPIVATLFAACSGGDDTNTPADAGTDTLGQQEASLPDKRPNLPDVVQQDAATCFPGDVTGYAPAWVPPVQNPDACTDVQISDFFAKCYNKQTSNKTACQAFFKTFATCAQCLDTAETAKAYGALVEHSGYVSINVEGCEAIVLGDKSATGCAAKDQAQRGCLAAACQANCPVTDSASLTEFNNCQNSASKNQCKTYTAAKCDLSDAGVGDSGLAVSVCFGPYPDFEGYFKGVAPVFCGGKPAPAQDGGSADSGSADAKTD